MSPELLITRALMQGDLWTDRTPPMVMRAGLQVPDGTGGVAHGNYTFEWVSPSQWREEIRFANYSRIRVGEAKGYQQSSELSFQPEFMFQLDKLLQLKDSLKIGAKQTLGKIKNRKNAGAVQNCIDVKWESGTERTLCFDDTNGSLLSIEYAMGGHQPPPAISRIEYTAFHPFAGKLIPFEIRALKDRKVVAAVTVSEIGEVAQADSRLFKPPARAEFWAHCDDMLSPELVGQSRPRYPASARDKREQGRVIIYAVIETDGSVSHTVVIHKAAPDLEAAAVETVRQWRYKPGTCGQIPVRVETSIQIDFWLEQ